MAAGRVAADGAATLADATFASGSNVTVVPPREP